MKPTVLELVGLPGTGKTTLTAGLLEAGNGRVERASLGGWRRAPLAVRSVFGVALPFLHQCGIMGRRRWYRLSMMVWLELLRDALSSSTDRRAEVVVLDQGPVYILSILQRALRSPNAGRNSPVFLEYWDELLADWAQRLDYVVRLEADDAVLYRRILERNTPHPVMGMDEGQASSFFSRLRRSEQEIVSRLQLQDAPPVSFSLRTDRARGGEVVGRILDEIGCSSQ